MLARSNKVPRTHCDTATVELQLQDSGILNESGLSPEEMSAIRGCTLPGEADSRSRQRVFEPGSCSHTSMRRFRLRRTGTSDEKILTLRHKAAVRRVRVVLGARSDCRATRYDQHSERFSARPPYFEVLQIDITINRCQGSMTTLVIGNKVCVKHRIFPRWIPSSIASPDGEAGETTLDRHDGRAFESLTTHDVGIYAVASVVDPILASPEETNQTRRTLKKIHVQPYQGMSPRPQGRTDAVWAHTHTSRYEDTHERCPPHPSAWK